MAQVYDPVAACSRYIGAVSLILMAINQFLATRCPGLERFFGPLDSIFVLHKWVGLLSLVAVALHAIIDAEIRSLPSGPLADPAVTWGNVGFYGLVVLAALSITTFLPYNIWKWSHRFIGVFFAMAVFHYYFIEKPFSDFSPAGLYMSFFCVLGMVSVIWMAVVRPLSSRGHSYIVTSVRQLGSVTEVELYPRGRGITHEAGQFAFLKFKDKLLSEEHPYTLSAAPREDKSLRFSIKNLGDYTKRLREHVCVGMEASVSRPFGRFLMPKGNDPQVWIGAGVGITPFLAFAESLRYRKAGPVVLYYCVYGRYDIPYLEELRELVSEVPNLRVVVLNSLAGMKITPSRIAADLMGQVSRAHVFYCGPAALREDLKAGLKERGLRSSRFHYERFDMRSGVGLDSLSDWISEQAAEMLSDPDPQEAGQAERT